MTLQPPPSPDAAAASTALVGDGLPRLVVDRRSPVVDVRPIPAWRLWLRRLHVIPIAMLLVAFGGFVGLYFQPPGLQKLMRLLDLQPGAGTSTPIAVPVDRRTPEPATGAAGSAVRIVAGLGRLLPLGDIRVIAPPFGAGDARIASLAVVEGEKVQKGAVLAVLDNERTLAAAVEAARGVVAAREAALRQVREQAVASRDEARALLAKAEAASANAQVEFERAADLVARGVYTRSSLDLKRALRDQAVQEVAKAKATLARFDVADMDTQADVVLATRNVESAKADLARAEADLEKAYIRAPLDGTVLTINARAGEKPGAQGIMTFGNIDQMMAEIEIYQTLIGAIAVGDPVTITADALPKPLQGKVTRIGLEVGRQTLTETTPAANTDARVVKVYVDLDPASTAIARPFTNLQVTARIEAGRAR
jgi:HlyD family secretion protein